MEVSNDDSFTGQLHLGTITFAQMAPGLTVKMSFYLQFTLKYVTFTFMNLLKLPTKTVLLLQSKKYFQLFKSYE